MARKTKKTRKSRAAFNAPTPTPGVTRRGTLRLLRGAAIAVPAVGLAGYFGTGYVRASICEFDLTKIGDGLPSIVQVHDPQCPLCSALQRQTRRALRPYNADDFHFLVANVATLDGRLFAQNHGVSHVTLVLLDGDGRHVGTLHGPIDDDNLRASIAAHLDEYG
ncbi:hypothetical protein [Gymnodinialimonas ulvae]|uniref:hypothetical protein n=1 Tax=Gymnodinialimonas ulvae TaxID=3126504 RepID=UPI0030B71696